MDDDTLEMSGALLDLQKAQAIEELKENGGLLTSGTILNFVRISSEVKETLLKSDLSDEFSKAIPFQKGVLYDDRRNSTAEFSNAARLRATREIINYYNLPEFSVVK